MANTLLATNRAISATSNPQTNIEQANNTNGVQQQSIPTPSNVSTQSINQQSQGNTINPITIPIQIQPEIQAQPVQQNTANNIQSLQVSNQQQQVNTPKPQTYSAPTTNNTISYDQIYASYRAGLRSVRDRDACPKFEKTPAEVRDEYRVLFEAFKG